MRVSLKSLLAAGLAMGAIGSVASAATLTLSSTVEQAGTGAIPQSSASYPLTGATPYTFTGQVNSFANVTSVDSLTVTVTSILDGDTGVGDYDRNQLFLGLDGVNTGLALNDLPNNGISTVTLTQLAPALQAALIAALQDGTLVGTIIDLSPGNATPAGDIISIPALDTTLDLTLSGPNLQAPGGGNVPLPAAVLVAPLGACVAGIYSRRFRKAK